MAIGSVWKTDDKFVIQFNEVRPGEKRFIFNLLRDWNTSGQGFHKDGTEVFLFSNKILDEDKLFQLVKSMPFPFTEEKKSGKSKKISTNYKAGEVSLTPIKKHGKVGGRTCSKCGIKGHNARTCKA